MTNRIYGCVAGKDSEEISKLLHDSVKEYGLGCADLHECDVAEIESYAQPEVPCLYFELTDYPGAVAASVLLDPADWSPDAMVPVPISLEFQERLLALISLFESILGSSSSVESLAVAMTDHDIEDVKRLTLREFRSECLSDFEDYVPSNILYVISRQQDLTAHISGGGERRRPRTERRALLTEYQCAFTEDEVNGADIWAYPDRWLYQWKSTWFGLDELLPTEDIESQLESSPLVSDGGGGIGRDPSWYTWPHKQKLRQVVFSVFSDKNVQWS